MLKTKWILACASMTIVIADAPRATAAELAPSGVLVAVYNSLSSAEARFDNRKRAVVGPAAELTRELARRLNVPFEMTSVEGVPAVIESVKTHRADIGFAPCDPSLSRDVQFSEPYGAIRNVDQCIVVARGISKLEVVNRFIADARASGKLRQILTQ